MIKNDPSLYFRTGLAFSFEKNRLTGLTPLSKSGITEPQARPELERVCHIIDGITKRGSEFQDAIQKVVDEVGAKFKVASNESPSI
jgi:hypothetical protein